MPLIQRVHKQFRDCVQTVACPKSGYFWGEIIYNKNPLRIRIDFHISNFFEPKLMAKAFKILSKGFLLNVRWVYIGLAAALFVQYQNLQLHF